MTIPEGSTIVDRRLAYTLLRVIIGVNIALHGITRIAMGTDSFAHSLVPMFAKTPLPAWSVYAFGLCLPWAEALTGLLVLAGAASRVAYVLGMLQLAALTFGVALRQDWPTASLQLTYALVYCVLLAGRSYNRYSIDGWIADWNARKVPRMC